MTSTLTKNVVTLLASKSPHVTSLKYLGVWTSDKIIKSPYKDVDIPNRTIPEHVWENLGRWPDKPSLVSGKLLLTKLIKNNRNKSQVRIKKIRIRIIYLYKVLNT